MRTSERFLIVVCLFALLFLNACATVAHGRYQSVPVNSSPSGANVAMDCNGRVKDVGQTPVIVKLKRKADRCNITLTKDGYEPTSVVFAKSVSGWMWGNLIFGDLVLPTTLIDYFDGAVYNRLPNTVQLTLAPQAAAKTSEVR